MESSRRMPSRKSSSGWASGGGRRRSAWAAEAWTGVPGKTACGQTAFNKIKSFALLVHACGRAAVGARTSKDGLQLEVDVKRDRAVRDAGERHVCECQSILLPVLLQARDVDLASPDRIVEREHVKIVDFDF